LIETGAKLDVVRTRREIYVLLTQHHVQLRIVVAQARERVGVDERDRVSGVDVAAEDDLR